MPDGPHKRRMPTFLQRPSTLFARDGNVFAAILLESSGDFAGIEASAGHWSFCGTPKQPTFEAAVNKRPDCSEDRQRTDKKEGRFHGFLISSTLRPRNAERKFDDTIQQSPMDSTDAAI